MRNLFVLATLTGVVAACGATPERSDDAVGSAPQEIVRGAPEVGRPQVVLIHWERFDGLLLRCSGVYVAPRVVLTAAHCLRDDLIPNRGFVYFGNDYSADLPQIDHLPGPHEPSVWARVENWERHPDWDPTRYHPDLGVVYVDRLLPFAPLPIAGFHLGDDWAGRLATAAGWGAEAALAPDLDLVSGVGLKRAGQVRIVGSPTEADYHPDDPNAGMLVPEIREHTLKTDGRAPLANICAGDSGGPLLARSGPQEQVVGIASWTGLGCEDYALYSRLDPFLPFVERSFARGGWLPLRPDLACVAEGNPGQLTAYFGYDNENAVTVYVPYGWFNVFPQDHHRQRPSDYRPGRHPWAFRVRFSAWEHLNWLFVPPGGPLTWLSADANSPRCDFSQTHGIPEACEASDRAACGESFADCADRAFGELEWVRSSGLPCIGEFEAIERCTAALPPSDFVCSATEPIPADGSCAEQSQAYIGCLGF